MSHPFVSTSKACFAFKGNKNKRSDVFNEQEWYNAFRATWCPLKSKLKALNGKICSELIRDVVKFVSSREFGSGTIPTVALFTGINLPDHEELFYLLKANLLSDKKCFVSTLKMAKSLKSLLQNVVASFVQQENRDEGGISGKKCDMTLPFLVEWYEIVKGDDKLPLILVIADFETYPTVIMQEFLAIIGIYSDRLPFVVIFGVNTTLSAIHDTLPGHVLSKLDVHLFKSQPSVVFLNKMLDEVFLTMDCPFQLDGGVFQLLTDIFMFYNFSVIAFVKGIKLCMMNHFYASTIPKLLCCPFTLSDISPIVDSLNESQIDVIMQLPSVLKQPPYQYSGVVLKQRGEVKEGIKAMFTSLRKYISRFHTGVRALHSLVKDLPHAPLGTCMREVYAEASTSRIVDSPDFKKCFELLQYTSKDDLVAKIKNFVIEALLKHEGDDELVIKVKSELLKLLAKVEDATLDATSDVLQYSLGSEFEEIRSRSQLKRKLFDPSRQISKYEKCRNELLVYLSRDFFRNFLLPLHEVPAHELTVYSDISMIKRAIVGTLRASTNQALINPHSYLQCKCCSLVEKDGILKSMPDICVVYKLHLECGNLINLYDWLQSFNSVENSGGEEAEANEKIKCRFARAVAELHFLGFVKASTRKADHVAKLTY